MKPSTDAKPTGNVLILAFTLVAAGLIAYSNSLHVPFVLDDTASITDNASIRRLFPLGPILSPPADAGVGGRPISNLSFALNHAIGGLDVRGYHVVNLAIHLAAGLTLFGVVRRTLLLPAIQLLPSTTAATQIAFGAALIWLLHPLQTEAVTYVSQRTESLMALFYLLTVYGFIRGAQTASVRWFSLAVFACVLGMATKEVMVTAPVVIFLYDRTFIGGTFRAAWEQRKKIHIGFAATWLVLLGLLVDVHERGIGYAAVSWWEYALTESRAILHYLRLAFWPAPLVFDYGTEFAHSLLDVWPQVLALASLAGATGWALWRKPMLGFLGAWLLVILAPTSSVVPVAGQPMAEHRMCLPLAAVAVATVLAAHRCLRGWTFRVSIAIGALLAYATFDRNRDYQSAIQLWTDTIEKRPQNARAHAALGAALLEKGDLPSAIASLKRAVQLDPSSAEAHNNLATALLDENRPNDALAHFAASLRLRPGTASTHYNYGNALLSLGRVQEAIAQQQQALILRAEFPEGRCALADALSAAGRRDDAIVNYREALRLRPDLAAAHYGLANTLAQSGRATEAVPHFEATLRAAPDSLEVHYNLGNALFAVSRPADAAQHYAAAVRLKPDFAEAYNNLANALVLIGRTAEAVTHYETALRLQPGLEVARANLEKLRKGAGTPK